MRKILVHPKANPTNTNLTYVQKVCLNQMTEKISFVLLFKTKVIILKNIIDQR